MSTILIIIIVIGVAVVSFLGFIATRPNDFRLERSALVNAPAATVFPLIADFHRWTVWSPFEKMETEGALKRSYGGAASGLGATYGWEGPKTGVGAMEIIEADTDRRLLIKLDFFKPFEAHNMAEFTLAPEAGGTRVTWAMFGPQPFVAKLMSLVFNNEKMMGPVFLDGLAAMKAAAEG
ncbi:MAG: SRPBCC family protein [Caulobacter sp.]|nr:SRPBCC family protein [Caulobacter sp.]